MEDIVKPSHRPCTTGFYFDEKIKQTYKSSAYIRNYDIVGIIKHYNKESNVAIIEQRNKVYNGDFVEVFSEKGENNMIKLENIKNKDGEVIESAAAAQMIFTVQCSHELKSGDMLIKKKEQIQKR
jgi:putative protease